MTDRPRPQIAVVGDRLYPLLHLVEEQVLLIAELDPGAVVISDGQHGVGITAEMTAYRAGLQVVSFRVNTKGLPTYHPDARKEEFIKRARLNDARIAANCDEMVVFWHTASRHAMHLSDAAHRLRREVRLFLDDGEFWSADGEGFTAW